MSFRARLEDVKTSCQVVPVQLYRVGACGAMEPSACCLMCCWQHCKEKESLVCAAKCLWDLAGPQRMHWLCALHAVAVRLTLLCETEQNRIAHLEGTFRDWIQVQVHAAEKIVQKFALGIEEGIAKEPKIWHLKGLVIFIVKNKTIKSWSRFASDFFLPFCLLLLLLFK